MSFFIFGDLDINLFDEGDYDINKDKKNACVESDLPCNRGVEDDVVEDDVHLVQTYAAYENHEARQMREINQKSDEKCDIDIDIDIVADMGVETKTDAIFIDDNDNDNVNDNDIGSCCGNICNDIYVHLRPIELLINTAAVEEVIFKKHIVEILDKHTRAYVMEGVVVGYDIVGQSYDPDIVLKFQDGRTLYNENSGYLLRYYI
jgi:hypothetical protein